MKFRVGIIGCGVICENHLGPVSENSNTDIIAVCDVVKDKADKIALMNNCKVYYNHKDRVIAAK